MTRATNQRPNHILHLVLSVLTFGLWIVVWIMAGIAAASNWPCDECGANTWVKAPRAVRKAAATPQQPLAAADTMPCPWCAETIKAAALICRHCDRPVTAHEIA